MRNPRKPNQGPARWPQAGRRRDDPQWGRATRGPREPARVLARLDRLAWLLDSSVRVPLTNLRIGIDGLIGLVPVVGDIVSAALSLYLIAEARRCGLPKRVQLRMGANMLIDAALGAIPILGDLFDFGFKANRRNVDLVRRFLDATA